MNAMTAFGKLRAPAVTATVAEKREARKEGGLEPAPIKRHDARDAKKQFIKKPKPDVESAGSY